MLENWPWYLLLLPAGLVAGVVNTIAGGGSFLTLPALMACGLPPQVANGSNRIAILVQSGLGAGIYRRQGQLDGPATLRLAAPMLVGAVAGAWLAAVLDEAVFRRVFGGLFLAMAVVLVARSRSVRAAEVGPACPRWVEVPLFAALGVYAGFIQAGVGVLLLVAMPLVSGLNLARANGVKLALVMAVQVLALAVFLWHGQVDWLAGVILAAGNTAGAPIGARLAMRRGGRLIFGCVLVVMVATGVKLLWPA